MQRKPLLWQLFPSYLLITLVSLVAVSWYAWKTLPGVYREQMAQSLESMAHLIENQIVTPYESGDFDEVDRLCKRLGKTGDTRITVILPSGLVVADSQEDPSRMDNHGDRPEIIQALGDIRVGVETRFSDTLEQKMMYVAIAMTADGETTGILRTSVPATVISDALSTMLDRIVAGGLVVSVIAAALSLVVSRRITRPLQQMRVGAEQFANGDFTHKLAEGNSLEIDALAKAMNKMASVVMKDITRLRRLERVRQDFVANVSHELKTPITSIKGFVETLIDGAINEPEDAQRFLQIIDRQAGRLNAIINDLLTLSKLEQQTETMEISLKKEKIKNTIEAAIELCEIKSTEKNITIKLDCDEDLTANINDPLLEQALVNLIDNAIKYSEPQSNVEINAAAVGDEIQISIQDHGCGIEQKYLPRLFERFYRVDKARSRKLGGTGLGLAIVKHIAQAHRGKISAESSTEKGSKFTIHLPIKPA